MNDSRIPEVMFLDGRIPPTSEDTSALPVFEDDPDHLLTPATVMSATRPLLLGPTAAAMLVRGDRGVTPLIAVMAASDAEGKVARAIDIKSIRETGFKNGYGTTEFGKLADTIADSTGFLEVAAAALASPRISKLGKLAVGIVLAQEGVKSTWAVRADRKHQRETGERLVLEVTDTGKKATAAKFAALTAAALTHDLNPGKARTRAGVVAVGSATIGAFLGEKARHGYKRDLALKK